MKKIIISVTLTLLAIIAYGQNQVFYYYEGNKVYLTEQKELVLIHLKKGADKSKVQQLILTDLNFLLPKRQKDKPLSEYIVLESSLGLLPTNPSLLRYLNSEEVLSATFMLRYGNQTNQGITDEFIVKLKPSTTIEQLQSLITLNNVRIVKDNDFVKNQYLLSVNKTASLNAIQAANIFFETGLFEFAEPNFFILNPFNTNDPLWGNQWPLRNTGQDGGSSGADIKVEQAWNIIRGRPEVRVAVVDEGVDLDHPDLAANLDIGFDATGNGTNGGPLPGESHGTACAGIIGAIQDNNIGISGVAPLCRIMPVHISFGQGASLQSFADGIEWAWQNGADVISNSWKFNSPFAAVTNAITNATTQGRGGLGTVVLVSSGNDNSSVSFPATHSNVIAVGATTNKDIRTDYSNYGSELDLVAPGGDKSIYTTDVTGSDGYDGGDYTSTFDGTSAACPHAAGVAALVLSVNRCLTWEQVKQILELSCDKVGAYCYNNTSGHPNGTWNNEMGHGRINAHRAVRFAFSQGINNYTNVSSATDNSTTDTYQMVMYTGCSGVAAASYFVKRHEVVKDVTYPYVQAVTILGTSNGLSAASPNDGNYWMDAVNVTNTSARLRTFVYEVYNVLGQQIGWVPTSPSNIKFNYAVLSAMEQDIFLQDDTVSTDSKIHNAMGGIYAGNNVTNSKPQGDYIVEGDANVTLHAGREIILGPGTHIKPGPNGHFRAYVDPFFTCTQFPQGIAPLPTGGENNTAGQSAMKREVNYVEEYETIFLKTEELKSKKLKPKVYPTPFTDNLTIEYTIEQSEIVTISLYSIAGQELIQLKNKSKHEQGAYKVELSGINLPTGTYMIKIITDNNNYSQKIIKN